MLDEPLVSYAQNGEDIVLWRALGHISGGIYVDVGGWDPDLDSVTRLFYDRGWRGVDVEPIPEHAERFRERRPSNEVVQAVITDDLVEEVVLHRFDSSGLSTVDDELAERHGLEGREHEDIIVPARRLDDVLASSSVVVDTIHFLKIDVEGAEEKVLRSVDLARWRPWVLVVEATEPNSTVSTHSAWEPILLAAGYTFTLFDGLSRFYVSTEHPELAEALSYPACPQDWFERAPQVALRHKTAAQEQELLFVREQAALARREADELRLRLGRVREKLQRVRTERKALRAELTRISSQTERVDQPDAADGSVRGRLLAAARKATGQPGR